MYFRWICVYYIFNQLNFDADVLILILDMPMKIIKDAPLPCYCKSHMCSGMIVSSKTVQRHNKQDLEAATVHARTFTTLPEERKYQFVRINFDEQMYETDKS